LGLDLIKLYPKDLSNRATLLRKLKPLILSDDEGEGDHLFDDEISL
jgi:hypothetical protein